MDLLELLVEGVVDDLDCSHKVPGEMDHGNDASHSYKLNTCEYMC